MATRRSTAPLAAVPTQSRPTQGQKPTTTQNTFPSGGPAVSPATPARQELPVPAHALPQRSSRELLTMARRGLEEAATMRPDGMGYATPHLAAPRAAAAALA